MRNHVWPVVCMVMCLFSVPALAIWPEDDPPTEPGIQPDRVYQVFKPDSIDLSTGTLSMMIPVGQQYPVSSAFQYGIGLSYDSNIWDFDMWIETGQCEDPQYPFECERRRQAFPDKRNNAGLGWQLTLGRLYSPLDPLNPMGSPYWIYIGPDGSQHRFWDRMYSPDRVGLSSDGEGNSYWYTRDGSYLRMKFDTSHPYGDRWVEFPDGSVHTFHAYELGRYRLSRMEEGSGNGVDVSYGNQNGNILWTLQDDHGRTHTIEFESRECDGQDIDVVSRISLEVFGGGTADYLFSYFTEDDLDEIHRSKKDTDDQTNDVLTVPLLEEVTLPDGTSYAMVYHRDESPEGDDVSGLIKEMRLPTLGEIEWQWQTWEQPGADQLWPWIHDERGSVAGFYRDWPGIKEKVYRDRAGAGIGTWQYDIRTCDPIPNTELDQERQTVVRSPVGDATVHYFRALPKDANGYEAGITRWDFALPYTRRVQQDAYPDGAEPLFLSVEQYEGDIEWPGLPWECTIAGTKRRSTYVTYENTWRKDGRGDNSYRAITRHPVARRTVYHDDGDAVHDTYWFDFDGHGNFRTRVDRGTFVAGTERMTFTNYNADRGTFRPALGYLDFDDSTIELDEFPREYEQPGESFAGMLPAGGFWILHKHDFSERFAIDREALLTHSRTDVCFDAATDLLTRTRALEDDDFPAVQGAHDVVVVYERNSAGEIARRKIYGGDNQTTPNPIEGLCSQQLPSLPEAWMEYEYQYGTMKTATPWDSNPGGTSVSMGYNVHDWDIDWSTGKPSTSRDTAGLPTEYEFDEMGWLTWIKPTGQAQGAGAVERGALTQVCYTPAQGDDEAKVEVLSRPNASTVQFCTNTDDVLTRSSVTFDDIGRLSGEYTLLPGVTEDGPWNQRLHGYDGLSREIWVTEWQELGAAELHKTEYVYDRFDRPTAITPPDGASHKVSLSYVGDRLVQRTAKVATWRSGTTVNETSVNVSTMEFDILGNLWKLTEPAGPAGEDVITTYNRDAADRLRKVSIESDGYTQHRTWTYDGRGFLLSETVPEKFNGTVSYSNHNVRGKAGTVTDGPNELAYVYDPAGRLESVTDAITEETVRELTYSTENGSFPSDLALGKLKTARAENHFYANPDVQGVFEVEESYIYGGMDGRPSRRNTIAGIEAGCGLEEFNVEFRWTPLGDIAEIEFPEAPGEGGNGGSTAQSSKFEYAYSHGHLSEVEYVPDHYPIPIASFTHYPNLTVNRISLGNGARTDHVKDPNDMARPRRIRAYDATNGKEWDSGTYLYDGVGNIKAMKTGSTTAHTMTYDGVSRITEWAEVVENSDQEVRSYEYDGFGNLKNMGPVGFNVDSWTNHISGAGYDDAGNLTEWGGGGGGGGEPITYTYYPTNELETMLASSWTSVYAYSADGERIARYDFDIPETANGTTYVIRDLRGKPLRRYYETGCSFAWQQDWIWGDGRALATVDGEGLRFFHLDHLGTPRSITGSDGNEVAQHDYYPFGTEIPGSILDGEAVKFTGHERDLSDAVDTREDLDYMHARYYSPHLGRFLSVDPVGGEIGSSQSWNRYSYVRNNPMNMVDPTGEAGKEVADWIDRQAAAAVGYVDANTGGGVGATLLNATVGTAGDMVSGAADMLRVGDSTGQAIGEGATGEDLVLSVTQDVGRASALALSMAVPANSAMRSQGAAAGARTAPRNLAEKLTLDEAKGGAGKRIMQGKINDPKYPEGDWAKMQQVHEHSNGTQTVIHYWENLETGAREGFKFK